MNERAWQYLCQNRGVTRLCHLTNISSMFSMALDASYNGILATAYIPLDNSYQNDHVRMDQHTEYVNCSCQYPNYKYFYRKQDCHKPFNTWCCLFLSPQILLKRTAMYSPFNAARGSGKFICSDMDTISRLFSHPDRRDRLRSCPDDIQAEILIERDIPWSYVTGIAVEKAETAQRIYRTLVYQYGRGCPRLYVAPDIFSNQCERFLCKGLRPQEEEWKDV